MTLWANHHKVWAAIILLAMTFAALWAGITYYQYLQKFSKADYDQLTTMAETVLKNSGGKDVQVSRTCSYERPSEFADLHLYCRVAMVTYLPYISDEQATTTAKKIYVEVKKVGAPLIAPDEFYERPSDNEWTLPTNLANPYPKVQCNFEVATKRAVQTLGLGLPSNNSPDLIALGFYCAAESRAEYFPVTYRQG